MEMAVGTLLIWRWRGGCLLFVNGHQWDLDVDFMAFKCEVAIM